MLRVKRSVSLTRNISFLSLKFLQLLQEYGLDFRYMLDEILVEHPKKPLEAKPALSLNEHRVSKFSEPKPTSSSNEKKNEKRLQPEPVDEKNMLLPDPPDPPALSAPPPPINRRNKAPASISASQVPPPANIDVPYPPPELTDSRANENSHPPSSAALRHNILSSTSVSSAHPTRFENGPANAPLFSSRSNQVPYPPLSALRARTPVSTAAQQDSAAPNSAPVPQTNLSSPLPRPPMSAAPFRLRERSDSVKDKDIIGWESTREGEGTYYDQPSQSAKASTAPRTLGGPPPRSANRPGSAMSQRTPVAVAQHEGMI